MLRQKLLKGARNFELFIATAQMALECPKTLKNFTGEIQAFGALH
jgi:hypothetical protein